MSSLMPSEKNSCSGSSLMLVKGSTAMPGGRAAPGPSGGFTGFTAMRALRWDCLLTLAQLADETEPFSRYGTDQVLMPAVVADCPPRGVDPARERRFRNDPSLPDGVDQIVFADDTIMVFHEIHQQVEYLRLDRDLVTGAGELASIGIKHMISKQNLHVG
jgi:hypothetical protein